LAAAMPRRSTGPVAILFIQVGFDQGRTGD
jgi:hypothetical protein